MDCKEFFFLFLIQQQETKKLFFPVAGFSATFESCKKKQQTRKENPGDPLTL